MASVPNGLEILRKISITWVGCTNVADDRQTDGRSHIANVNVSSRSLKTEKIEEVILDRKSPLNFGSHQNLEFVSGLQMRNIDSFWCTDLFSLMFVEVSFVSILTWFYNFHFIIYVGIPIFICLCHIPHFCQLSDARNFVLCVNLGYTSSIRPFFFAYLLYHLLSWQTPFAKDFFGVV